LKLKDKRIEILQPSTSKDADGFSMETITPIAPPQWAYFRQLSSKEIYANATTIATEQVLFTVSYRPGITTVYVVRFRGVLYDITRVDVFEGYKGDISLYCRLKT